MNKFFKKNIKILIVIAFLFLFVFNTVAYSGLASKLSITSDAMFRAYADIRVTGIKLKSASNGALENYSPKYNVDNTTMGFTLPNNDSSITYEVTVTNFGDRNQTIYSFIEKSINKSGISITISDNYKAKDIIKFKSSVTFTITIKSTNSDTTPINLIEQYEFRKVYDVEYKSADGKDILEPQYKYEKENLTLRKDIIEKTDYDFKGWTCSLGDFAAGGTYTLDQDIILYPKFEKKKGKLDLNYIVDGTTYYSGYNKRIQTGIKVGGVDKGYLDDFGGTYEYGTSYEIYGFKLDEVEIPYSKKYTVDGNNYLNISFNTINFKVNDTSLGSVTPTKLIVIPGTTYKVSNNVITLSDGRIAIANISKDIIPGYTIKFSKYTITPSSTTINALTTVTANFVKDAEKYTITLDNKSATTAGTTAIYEKYNTGIYLDSALTKVMTTTTNKITVPAKTGYTFKGYYTKENGQGDKIINENGYITDSITNTTYTANATLYAYFKDETKPTLTLTNSSNGNWTNKDVTVKMNGTDAGSGIKEYQWKENGTWTTRAISITNGVGSITYTADRNLEIEFRVIDNAGNISDIKTTYVRKDTVAPKIELNGKASSSEINNSNSVTIPIKITETASGMNSTEFTISDISVLVNGTPVNPSTKILTYNSVSNGVYSYTLTLGGIALNGKVTLEIAAGAVKDVATNSSVKTTLDPSITVSNAYTISLNGNGATTQGTTAIYEKYNTGIYLDSELKNAMTTGENAITVPTKSYTVSFDANNTGITIPNPVKGDYDYLGHYTAATNGTQMINENGYITSSFKNTSYTANGTLYAHWGTKHPVTIPEITKDGYTCSWNTSKDASGTTYNKGDVTDKLNTQTLYAVCKANSYKISYDNNYLKNDLYGTTSLNMSGSAATTPKSKTLNTNANAKYGKEIEVTMSSGNGGGPYFPYVSLTSGKTYTWIIYAKTSTDKTLKIGHEQGGTKTVNVTTEWQRFTYTFTANDSNYKAFIFYTGFNGSTWNDGDKLYVHSLELAEIDSTILSSQDKTYGTTLGTLPSNSRTGYTFSGWYTASIGGTQISSTTSVPSKDTTYYAHWTPNTNTKYIVKHYKQKLDGTYPNEADDTDNLTGTTDSSVSPTVKDVKNNSNYVGFTAPSVQTVTIKADGSTVVTYKYTRNKYTFTLGSATGVSTSGSTTSGSYYYGSTITLKATASAGYTWSKWISSNTGLVANQTNASSSFTMPVGNVTMTPNVTVNALEFSAQEKSVTYNSVDQNVTITGASNGSGNYSYAITDGNTSNYFTISGTTITVKASTPAGTYALSVVVFDKTTGATSEKTTITIKVNPKTITPTAQSANYNGGNVFTKDIKTGVKEETLKLTYTTNSSNQGTYSYATSDATGKYTLTVANGTGSKDNYTISNPGTFTINKVSATCPTVTAYSAAYDGAEHGVGISGGSGGTIQYRTSTTGSWTTTKPTITNKGSITTYVQIVGDGNHTTTDCGSKTVTVNAKTITPTNYSVTYNTGNVFSRTYSTGVKSENITLTYTTNLPNKGTYSYATSDAAGKYTLTVTNGTGSKDNYTISSPETITINPYNLSNSTISGVSSKTYNGSEQTQNPTVTVPIPSGKTTTLVNGTDFTLSYSNNINAGTKDNPYATMTVTGKGNYTGTKSATFTISQKEGTCTIASVPTLTYPSSKTGTIKYSCTGDGKVTITSSNTDIITISNAKNTSADLTAKTIGTIKITVSQAAGNYKASSVSVDVKVIYSTYSITLNGNGATTNGNLSAFATYNSTALSTITNPIRKYTITYNMGTTGITKPTNGEVNYTFNGWYTAASNGTKVASNSTTPTLEANVSGYTNASKQWTKESGATLYAGWTQGSTTLATLGKTGNSCSWKDSSGNSYTSGKTGFTTSSNITLTANCTVNQYLLTVNPNGGSWNNSTSASVITQNYGTTYTVANPIRTGYTFTGWSLITNYPETCGEDCKDKLDGNIYTFGAVSGSIRANWKVNNYTVTFDYNGGTTKNGTTLYKSTSRSDETYAGKYKLPTNPTRPGYDFAGWYTTSTGGTKVTTDTTISTASNHTLYAHWSIKNYTLTVNPNGGAWNNSSSASVITQNYGTTKTITNPTRTGYTFKGWVLTKTIDNSNFVELMYQAPGYAGFTNEAGAKSANTVNLYSQLGQLANFKYNDKYEFIIESDENAKKYRWSQTSNPLTTTSVTGYTNISNGFGGLVYNNTATLLAVSSANNNWWGAIGAYGSGLNPISNADSLWTNRPVHFYVKAANDLSNLSNYTITGALDSSNNYIFRDENVTLQAIWAPNTYTVKYDGNGATSGSMANDSAVHDSNFITTKNAFARIGYTFNGWNEKADGTGTAWGLTTSGVYESGKSWKWTYTKDITLYAQWTLNTYTITYNLNGGAVSTANPTSYNVTTATFTLNNPSKTGYIFAGWTGSNGTTAQTSVSIAKGSTGNKSYTANWTANPKTPYKVVHQQMGLDGSTYTTVATENLTGTTGASITPAVKSYTGFTSPSTQTTTIAANGSTVVTYKYTRNKYAYTLGSGTAVSTSGSTASGSYYYGSTITLKATVSAGYTWSKWTSSNTGLVGNQTTANTTFTMPAGAITMTPSATLNTYTITYNLNGGAVSTANPTSYNVTTATFTLNNPTRTGYEFAGWTGSNGTTAQKSVSIAKGSTGNKSYTANWTAEEYTITLNGNGASTAGTSAIYERYASGIYLDRGTNSKQMTTSANPITKPSKSTYTISYNANNTEVTVSNVSFTPVFNGYYTATSSGTQMINNNGYITSNLTNTKYTDNTTLYAQWNHSYKLSSISKTGYTCSWNTKSDGTGTKYSSGATVSITANTTYYAICNANSYTLKFEGNGGTVGTESKPVTYGQPYGTLSSATRADSTDSANNKIKYTFEGWYTAATGGTKVTAETPYAVVGDSRLYAHWISSPVITGGSSDWTSTSRTISLLTASTSDTGIQKYQYYLSTSQTDQVDGSWIDVTGTNNTTKIDSNGTKYIFYRAVSTSGVYSAVSNYNTIKIDNVAPSTTITGYKVGTSTTVASNTWSNAYLNFIFNSLTVGGSGGTIYYCTDTNNTCSPGTSIAKSTAITARNKTAGIYYMRYKVVNGAGVSSSVGSYTAKVDVTAPTFNIKVYEADSNGNKTSTLIDTLTSSKAISGWHNTSVYIEVTSLSDTSGISTDKNGIVLQANTGGNYTVTSTDATINTLTASYDITSTKGHAVGSGGNRYLKVTVKDKAGNSSSMALRIYIDKEAPTIKLTAYELMYDSDSKPIPEGKSLGTVTNATFEKSWGYKKYYFKVEATDNSNQIASMVWERNKGGSKTMNTTIATTVTHTYVFDIYLDADGARYSKITVKDKAGNSRSVNIKVYIDTVFPNVVLKMYKADADGNKVGSALKTIDADNTPINSWTNYRHYFDLTGTTDSMSGIASMTMQVNKGGIIDTGSTVTGASTLVDPVYNITSDKGKMVGSSGNRYVRIKVTDKAGNTVTKNIRIYIDLHAPTLASSSLSPRFEPSTTITYKCTDEMSGFGSFGKKTLSDTFKKTVTSSNSPVTVQCTDAAGNKSSDKKTYTWSANSVCGTKKESYDCNPHNCNGYDCSYEEDKGYTATEGCVNTGGTCKSYTSTTHQVCYCVKKIKKTCYDTCYDTCSRDVNKTCWHQ